MRFAHFTVDQVSSLIGLPRRSGRGSKTGGLPAVFVKFIPDEFLQNKCRYE